MSREEVNILISFAPLRKLMEKGHISTYTLRTKAGLSSDTVYRLLQDQSVTTNTLDALCKAFNCRLEAIVQYIPDIADNYEG